MQEVVASPIVIDTTHNETLQYKIPERMFKVIMQEVLVRKFSIILVFIVKENEVNGDTCYS